MRNMKKWLAGVLAVVMVVGLTGCSGLPFGKKEPTAKELVDGIQDIDPKKYYRMDIEMDVSGESDGQEIEMGVSATVEGKGDVIHLDGMSLDIGTSGFNMTVGMDAWADIGADVAYMNMSLFGTETGWTKSESDGTGTSMTDAINEFVGKTDGKGSNDKIEYVLVERDKKDKEAPYVVRWEADADVLGDVMETVDTIGTDDMASKLESLLVEAVFDHETHELESININGESDGFVVDAKIKILEVNGDKDLRIPTEVIEQAATSDAGSGLGGLFGGNIGLGGDDDSNGPGNGVSPIEGGRYTNDNNGYDEVIDGMAVAIIGMDPDYTSIDVNHYDTDMATLSYFSDKGDWDGEMTVEHVNESCTWYTTAGAFNDEYGWLSSMCPDGPYEGSRDEGYAIFVDENYGYTTVYMITYDENMYMEIEVNDYTNGGLESAAEHFQSFMAVLSDV